MEKLIEYSLKKELTKIDQIRISTNDDAYKFARNFFHEDISIYESMFAIFLNRNNQTIGYTKISQGGISATIVDPVIILKYAIESLSSGVILVHNHPSGNINPSLNDIEFSKKISDLLEMMGVYLLDSIIITEEECVSINFRENDKLE